ncbi:MAG: 1,4-alpha-glucan branching enzyme GlgB [Chlamydiales bacterium]|nr:1,4-alpha-glucan branching enzyme GlgB [Chlamydiales bacterium]
MIEQLDSLFQDRYVEPHSLLGRHDGELRLYKPGAKQLFFEGDGKIKEARQIDPRGLFVARASQYRIFHKDGLLAHDPYSFAPTWKKGDPLGAKECEIDGVSGVRFAVWAPAAKSVYLVGDFNFWDEKAHPMRCIDDVWELFVPGLARGHRYKFAISTMGKEFLKSDPQAHRYEVRPKNSSIVDSVEDFAWGDEQWMQKRSASKSQPINIYEVHLGSWKKPCDHFPNYRQLAVQLASYCKEMGYTHIELMPIMEHPLDESWGYQVSGYFAVSSRFGTPQDFQFFVNYLHNANIGVILDWVPAHFVSDDFALAKFDGSALYEYDDPQMAHHPQWKTRIFDYRKREVKEFLINSALFFLEKMHVDGLRVDAVSSMLYLDFGRESGQWQPNREGGNENLEAIAFCKELNEQIHTKFPDVITIAEEASAYPGVTKEEGLGFDYKWNMGWSRDTLNFFQNRGEIEDITFSQLYAFDEAFVLTLSHDDGALLRKMPGEYWEQFAALRLLLSFQICQVGKKLLFMGSEWGQWDPWNAKEQLQWHLLTHSIHSSVSKMVKVLNHLYLEKRELWELDGDPKGFEWACCDEESRIIAYRRKDKSGKELLCIHNLSTNHHPFYSVPLSNLENAIEIFNSDDALFGGSNHTNGALFFDKNCLSLQLAPLSTSIIQINFHSIH